VRRLNQILAHHCGQPYEKIDIDTKRDYFMTAKEAKDYGIVDEVLVDPTFPELAED
jgi:ATP-dependent Clp protease protease subunit